MEKKTIAGLIAIVAIVAVVIFSLGCVEKSSYQVEYSAIAKGSYPKLMVDVSGPADDLAIILTNPEEYTDVAHISKEEMIDNFERADVRMCENGNPPVGTYKLIIKTITPEKVVYKETLKFSGPKVRIEGAEINTEPWWGEQGYIESINLKVANDGDLPVIFDKVSVIVAGREQGGPYFGGVSAGEQKVIRVVGHPDPTGLLRRGTYTVRIGLYSGKIKFASFETEMTIE